LKRDLDLPAIGWPLAAVFFTSPGEFMSQKHRFNG
jgi:hypothetical protein